MLTKVYTDIQNFKQKRTDINNLEERDSQIAMGQNAGLFFDEVDTESRQKLDELERMALEALDDI